MVCRSTDGLKTWTCRSSLELPPGADHVIPFGDIAALPDGRLAVTGYTGDHIRTNTAWVFFSDDDGRTWGNPRPLGEDDFNESTLLVTGGKRLLAATRTHRNSHTHISVSERRRTDLEASGSRVPAGAGAGQPHPACRTGGSSSPMDPGCEACWVSSPASAEMRG